ncbi:MAG: hypothetical protein LBD40_02745 [Puniceicoccales bacterium]|jgi:hypothetical protein|nr:hypothetical protein [Puniceicoccales bacterium]
MFVDGMFIGLCYVETELSVIRKRLNDPNLSEFERDHLLTRQDFWVFIDQGCLSGDASYMANLIRQLRYDPDNPELNEKLLLARRDAFNRRDKKMERDKKDFVEFMNNLLTVSVIV